MKKWIILIVLLVFSINVSIGFFFLLREKEKTAAITSYEACAKAGFPVLESYPPVCKTPDGRSFTQDVGNELEYHDEIIVASPRPNQQVTSPFQIKGQARGSWFFEGQFHAELVDENNKSLGNTVLKAAGEWMTNDFVRFSGELVYKKTTSKGTLKIKNDNPSGLPENQKELVIPVTL